MAKQQLKRLNLDSSFLYGVDVFVATIFFAVVNFKSFAGTFFSRISRFWKISRPDLFIETPANHFVGLLRVTWST